MKEPQFYLANGDLSYYSFACGYIQKKESPDRWKHIYMEHGIFHVRSGLIINDHHTKFDIWEGFERLTDARKFYKSIKV